MIRFDRRGAAGVGLALALGALAATAQPTDPPRASGGVVSAATPEAAAAGVEILEAGGNAIDAAVAVSLALGVSEPAGSGLGGQTFILAHPPDGAPFVIAGSSRAPAGLPDPVSPGDVRGRRAATVPSTLKVLDHAWRRHGSGPLPWSRLVAPAIRIAEDGYLVGHFRHRSLMRYSARLRADPAASAMLLGPDGEVPEVGDRIRLPLLAHTLRRIAEAGASDFYEGRIAAAIDSDMAEHGGWMRLEDLKGFPDPTEERPLQGEYRGYDVHTLPPPTGGWVTLQALNLLALATASDLRGGTWSRRVWLAEALRVAHGNRLDDPLQDLVDYDAAVARRVAPARARELQAEIDVPDGRGETTHFSLADGEGWAVAVTQSLNGYYGAKVAHPTLGILYNDYMREFEHGRPGHPFALRPEGLPYSSMSATILSRDGRPLMAVGSPGSKRIVSAVVQVVSHWVDVGEGVRAAVDAPRLHVVPEDDLFMEARGIPADHLLELERRGYSIVRPLSSLHRGDLNPFFGGVHAVALEDGAWTGAADPRRDGAVGVAQED